jgi:hypothetical protein
MSASTHAVLPLGQRLPSSPPGVTEASPLGNSMKKILVDVDLLIDDDGKLLLSLPDITTIVGILDLRNTNIRSLPDNLSVRGLLELEGTPITSLPKSLKIGGYLNLCG